MQTITAVIRKSRLMTVDAMEFVSRLVKEGRKIGIFSCEDPYNTPFHRDILKLTDYIHLTPKAAGVIMPESLDLGLQAKSINAWGIFGHYGIVNGHEVCAAIKAIGDNHSNYGPDLKKHIDLLSKQYRYNPEKSLRANVIDWIETQYKLLLKTIPKKQKTLKDAVQGDIIFFGGIIDNSEDGKSYKARILFSNIK